MQKVYNEFSVCINVFSLIKEVSLVILASSINFINQTHFGSYQAFPSLGL